jgi:hypothetical protein
VVIAQLVQPPCPAASGTLETLIAEDHSFMNRNLTHSAITASCLLGSSLGSAAVPLGRELQSAAVMEAVIPLCVALQPDMAELYGEIITHWWEQNGAVREALDELASGSVTPEGVERQVAFEELVRQLRNDTTRMGAMDLARCCANFVAGLAAGLEPVAEPGGPCAAET